LWKYINTPVCETYLWKYINTSVCETYILKTLCLIIQVLRCTIPCHWVSSSKCSGGSGGSSSMGMTCWTTQCDIPEDLSSPCLHGMVLFFCMFMGPCIVVTSYCINPNKMHMLQFILSDNCSTYFRHHHHPSSGAQNNCNYSIW
jgi:hypothetical protein